MCSTRATPTPAFLQPFFVLEPSLESAAFPASSGPSTVNLASLPRCAPLSCAGWLGGCGGRWVTLRLGPPHPGRGQVPDEQVTHASKVLESELESLWGQWPKNVSNTFWAILSLDQFPWQDLTLCIQM